MAFRRIVWSKEASRYIRDALIWSEEHFGGPAAARYRDLIAYRSGDDVLEIIRVLHDARDLERHLPLQ